MEYRMAAFSARPVTYQVGILLLLVTACMFGVGMMLPWWAQTRLDGAVTSHSGLWLGCISASSSTTSEASQSSASSSASSGSSSSFGSSGRCSSIDAPDWFKAVQVMQCLALAGMGIACTYAIFINCCLDQVRFSRVIEISSGLGGAVGIVSGVLYVVKTSTVMRHSPHIHYSWAFGLDIAACVIVLIVAAIIGLTNSDPSRRHYDSGIASRYDEYLRRRDARLAYMDDEMVAGESEGRRLRSKQRSSRSRSRSPRPDSVRGISIEMERSPARTRRLDATSGEPSSGSGSGPATAEAMVVLKNIAGSGSATATILQRPASSPMDFRPSLPSTPQRHRSSYGDVYVHRTPLLISPSPLSVHGRKTKADCHSQCACSHNSLGYLSAPPSASLSRKSSRASISQGSCVTLHHNPLARQQHQLANSRSNCSYSHSQKSMEMMEGALCSCCSDNQLCHCLALHEKRCAPNQRVPAKECLCRPSEDNITADSRPTQGKGRRQSKGKYMSVPTECDDPPALALTYKTADGGRDVSQAAVRPTLSCSHCSSCPCRTDYRPVCAVHGQAATPDYDADSDDSPSFDKKPFLLDSEGIYTDLVPVSTPLLHNPLARASAPPIEAEYENHVTETDCTVFRQG